MGRILLVEDEESIRDVLSRYLTARGHTCEQACNGEEGVLRVREDPDGYDVIISDIHMPRLDGLAFLRRVQPYIDSVTPFMILTAYDELKHAMEAIRLGACNFLQKNPFDLAEIAAAVDRALELRHIYRQKHTYRVELETRLREKEAELQRTYDGTVIGFAAMMEGKDASTMQHLFRVRDYCRLLASKLGVPRRKHRDIELGSMLHDVGKFRIPDHILTKPGPLDDAEWVVMRKHPEYGAEFVRCIPFLSGATDMILYHHERYDGGGYPAGLSGEGIPLAARMFSVVDAYDAIVSKRCYKAAQPPALALTELRRCAGTQFDPLVVDAFQSIQPQVIDLMATFEVRFLAEMEELGLGQIQDRSVLLASVRQQQLKSA